MLLRLFLNNMIVTIGQKSFHFIRIKAKTISVFEGWDNLRDRGSVEGGRKGSVYNILRQRKVQRLRSSTEEDACIEEAKLMRYWEQWQLGLKC